MVKRYFRRRETNIISHGLMLNICLRKYWNGLHITSKGHTPLVNSGCHHGKMSTNFIIVTQPNVVHYGDQEHEQGISCICVAKAVTYVNCNV